MVVYSKCMVGYNMKHGRKFSRGVSTWFVIWRLSIGQNISPLYWRHNFFKLFPTPRVARVKEYITRYFIYN